MKVTIVLNIRGSYADVLGAVERALDAGALQDAIEDDDDADCEVESSWVLSYEAADEI